MTALPERRFDFEAVKALSVTEFLERQLGCVSRKVGSGIRMASCPSCGDSKSKFSHKVILSKDDRTWYCFSCGSHGSILDAAMALWGCSLIEAHDQLLGIRNEIRPAKPKIDRSAADADALAKTAKMRQAFGLIQKACLALKDEAEPLNYLVDHRKIPLPVVRKAQARGMVGFMPSNSGQATEFLVSAVGEDLLRDTGLWKPASRLPGIASRPLVFFMPNLSSAEFRLIGEVDPSWTKSIRYGTLEYPYWWQGEDAQCMIVEGMIDLLSVVALEYPGHVMGLTGCNTFIPSWFPAAFQKHSLKRFVIALDNDVDNAKNPGQTWAHKLEDLIKGLGMPCFVKTPERGDINDILKAKSK